MCVNNETGEILNIKEVYEVLKKYKIVFHCDMAQSFLKTDLNLLNYCDMFTISSHKIHGLKSIAALIIKNNITLNEILLGGGQEYGLRSGTVDIPLIASFYKAMCLSIDKYNNITTLGRGGSDTTAVAIQAAINADKCYIFSDVDGIYSSDPNMVTMAKRLDEITFDEMQEVADAGAKVLHNRCIQIGKKFGNDIIAKSTFTDEGGTRVCKGIETSEVKSIVKNDNLITVIMNNKKGVTPEQGYIVYKALLEQNIIVEWFERDSDSFKFRIKKAELNKVQELLDSKFPEYEIVLEDFVKITIVGYGITQDNTILNQTMDLLKKHNVAVIKISLTQSKIEIVVDEINEETVDLLHKKLIK